jgi:hypothetical protein
LTLLQQQQAAMVVRSGAPLSWPGTYATARCRLRFQATVYKQKKKLLPPVNWQWVEEGDGYVRREAWSHTPTVRLGRLHCSPPAAGLSAHAAFALPFLLPFCGHYRVDVSDGYRVHFGGTPFGCMLGHAQGGHGVVKVLIDGPCDSDEDMVYMYKDRVAPVHSDQRVAELLVLADGTFALRLWVCVSATFEFYYEDGVRVLLLYEYVRPVVIELALFSGCELAW